MSTNERTYRRENVVFFRKTKEDFGGLSNMAAGFPIKINNVRIKSSEALYQALRFTEYPEIQSEIIAQNSPMTAKMKSKKYSEYSRNDWNDIRVLIMRWCLRVKLIQNWESFGGILFETLGRDIVEESKKDKFWGAIPFEDDTLVGVNALGRLLMELRDEMPNYLKSKELLPPKISNLKLFGNKIGCISFCITEMPSLNDVEILQKKIENLTIFDIN
ncbi:NADAR family protein [Sporosarcina sp. OR05]|uniref:NADAR family protein n=1 Tax=Sporosarcina sp. OR05 TaxID=2969819 RepID=UPI00352BCB9F